MVGLQKVADPFFFHSLPRDEILSTAPVDAVRLCLPLATFRKFATGLAIFSLLKEMPWGVYLYSKFGTKAATRPGLMRQGFCVRLGVYFFFSMYSYDAVLYLKLRDDTRFCLVYSITVIVNQVKAYPSPSPSTKTGVLQRTIVSSWKQGGYIYMGAQIWYAPSIPVSWYLILMARDKYSNTSLLLSLGQSETAKFVTRHPAPVQEQFEHRDLPRNISAHSLGMLTHPITDDPVFR